jgi:hypothetical protein
MADLSDVKPTERVIEILHPRDKSAVGIRWRLMSIDDDRMEAVKRRFTDRRIHLSQRGKSFSAVEIDENHITMIATASVGWEWYQAEGSDSVTTFKGEVPDFNQANVKAVLKELKFVQNQLTRELDDTDAFFGG